MIPDMVGVPIKPFGVAKGRLHPVVDAPGRSRLGRAVAERTIMAIAASGAEPAVVTGDDAVAGWARAKGWKVIAEPPGEGLDGAARAVVAAAPDAWAIVHADLPTATPHDFLAVWDAFGERAVLVPSRDGGTAVIAGRGRFPFAYGPGSFHRHLGAVASAVVVTRPGLALDLDTPSDLVSAGLLAGGRWLAALLPS